jgi:hypothetical protein
VGLNFETAVVAARPDVISCQLGGGAALLDLRTSTYYGLNGIGSTVWGLIASPKTVAQLRDSLLNEYDVDPDLCHADLISLLGKLANAGLIEVNDAEPT